MEIECLVRRVGATVIIKEGVIYRFMPPPGTKKGEASTSVCDVTMQNHLDYFLDPVRRGGFREYDSERTAAEQEKTRSVKNLFAGFNIEKYQDKGYIVLDRREKQVKYHGQDGIPHDKASEVTPWPTEFQAYEWLKGEVEFSVMEEKEDNPPEPDKPQSSEPVKKKIDRPKLAEKGKELLDQI